MKRFVGFMMMAFVMMGCAAQQKAEIAQTPAPEKVAVSEPAPEPVVETDNEADTPSDIDEQVAENADDSSCATKLLEMNYSPTYLDECKGVEPTCALKLLEMGHHPTYLSRCKGIEPSCALKLLEMGHHPTYLDECKGVDPPCDKPTPKLVSTTCEVPFTPEANTLLKAGVAASAYFSQCKDETLIKAEQKFGSLEGVKCLSDVAWTDYVNANNERIILTLTVHCSKV